MNKEVKITIPTKEETDTIFENIRKDIENGLFKKLSPEETWEEIKRRMPTDFRIIRELNSDFNSISLFRCSIFSNRDITKKESFYYPPAEYTKKGRCNIDGAPVLYMSIDEYTTIFETKSKIGDEVYISEWILDLSDKDVFYEYSFFFSPEIVKNKESYAYGYSYKLKEQFDKNLESYGASEEIRENALYFLEKYQDIFRIKGDKYYHITSSIANNIFKPLKIENLKDHFQFDVISYPSISTNLESVNFAFHKDFSDKHIKIKSVRKGIVSKINENGFNFDCSEVGIADNKGNIKWKSFVDIQKSIVVENVFIKQTENIDGDYILANDKNISCCDKHIFSVRSYIDSIKPFFFKKPELLKRMKISNQIVSFKPDKQLFVEGDFNDSGKIKFLAFNCTITEEYKDYFDAILK